MSRYSRFVLLISRVCTSVSLPVIGLHAQLVVDLPSPRLQFFRIIATWCSMHAALSYILSGYGAYRICCLRRKSLSFGFTSGVLSMFSMSSNRQLKVPAVLPVSVEIDRVVALIHPFEIIRYSKFNAVLPITVRKAMAEVN